MKQETVYKAATAAAAALADGKQPENLWVHSIARTLRQGKPTEQRAFEAFLGDFRQPRLLRLVSRIPDEAGAISAFPDPLGETLTLFKPPLPGETQARLAYECFLDGFLAYLQRTHCICTLRETPAHVTLFVPQGRAFGLEDAWQKYVQDAFSRRGLTESFVLFLNSVQLAGRGFGVLDVPIVSEEQKQTLAGFYLAAVQQAERRMERYEDQLRELKRKMAGASPETKERKQLENSFTKLRADQQERKEKYRNAFEKKLLERIAAEEDSKSGKAKKRAKTRMKSSAGDALTVRKDERIQKVRELLTDTAGNPFEFLRRDEAARPDLFNAALQAASRYTDRGGRQLAFTVPDKFAGFVLEMYRLLEDDISFISLPSLLFSGLTAQAERAAGDASREWCYSCGKALGKKEPTYEVRRLLFSSPDQRPQSSFSSKPPKACATCAAIALTCPLKLSDQNVIVRLDPKDQTAGTADYLRDYCRMLTIGTLNTAAGRYLSLVCTERTAKGVLASARMGKVVYTVARLGLELPADVFRDFRLTLIVEGSEISLDPTVLFAVAGFLRGYGQRFIVGGDLNTTLGQAVRYMQAGAFYAAEYTIIANGSSFRNEIDLEQHREKLWRFLTKQTEEGSMTKNAEQRAKFYGDVAALTGLLYGFCEVLRNKAREAASKPEDKTKEVKRVLGKAIEYVDDSPAFFTYTAITNELSSEAARLYKDPSHHFLYDRAKMLLAELGFNDREKQENASSYLQLYFDDIAKTYAHFSQSSDYKGEREWKEFLYQVKLSLYSRFPECFARANDNRK